MNGFLDRLEKILQRRLDTAYVVEMDEDKAAIDAELIQIIRELRDDSGISSGSSREN